MNMLVFGLTRVVTRETLNFAPIPRPRFSPPTPDEGPAASNTCHINNVFYDNDVVFVSGTRCRHLLTINGQKLSSHTRLPFRTHNARPFRDSVLMNATRHDCVRYVDGGGRAIFFP